ncbi:MAG: N-6 DNA methylase [Firmicutes bacterium]|nr:N-6 DNA methylase [Bacillota bacterium]
MNNPVNIITHGQRRKRLGQYFTDEKLVDLLIALTGLPKHSTAIDPMAGTGNMLVGLQRSGFRKENLAGIEIDPVVGRICRERVAHNHILIGNAFRKETYEAMTQRQAGWDLVITNPPYVRYQALTNDLRSGLEVPNAQAIRQDLLLTIEQFSYLEAMDRKLLKTLVQSYSGLSDLAVPSWILCAALVKPGGKLAMVAPATWLNREYATIVQYLLLKWFRIEYVVEDVNSPWFMEAQVKTNLLVAKRERRSASIFARADDTYPYIKIYNAKSPKQERRRACPEEKELETKLRSLLAGRQYSVHRESMGTMLSKVSLKYSRTEWFQEIECAPEGHQLNSSIIPVEILNSLKVGVPTCRLATVRTLGLSVGQGLRTGANKFFYLTFVKKGSQVEYLQTNDWFGNKVLKVPTHFTRVVLRKQADLPRKLIIDQNALTGRVLYINEALPLREQQGTSEQLIGKEATSDQDLEAYIRLAEKTPLRKENPFRLIPEASAVKPNQRLVRRKGEEYQRFWYMLPPLVKRHIPDFCLSRVNHESPHVYMLLNQGVVVDANFVTLWLDEQTQEYKLAYFALLNSNWFKACLECLCTVMGGGALKVEAAQLKKVPLPILNGSDYLLLQKYGEALAQLSSPAEMQRVRRQIDAVILRRIFEEKSSEEMVTRLDQLVQEKAAQRKSN